MFINLPFGVKCEYVHICIYIYITLPIRIDHELVMNMCDNPMHKQRD